MSGPADNTDRCRRCGLAPQVRGCTPALCLGQLTDFERDSLAERGRILTGKFAHYCFDWDGMTVDETTPDEFDCCNCVFEGEQPPPKSQRNPGVPEPLRDFRGRLPKVIVTLDEQTCETCRLAAGSHGTATPRCEHVANGTGVCRCVLSAPVP